MNAKPDALDPTEPAPRTEEQRHEIGTDGASRCRPQREDVAVRERRLDSGDQMIRGIEPRARAARRALAEPRGDGGAHRRSREAEGEALARERCFGVFEREAAVDLGEQARAVD